MNFKLTDLNSFEDNIRREWALTNGLGSYAGSSVIGAHNRKIGRASCRERV